MHLSAHKECDKTVHRIGRNNLRQQRLVWMTEEFLFLAAPSSIAQPVIGQNVSATTRVLQKSSNLFTALAEDPKSVSRSLGKSKCLSREVRKNACVWPFFGGATQCSLKLASTAPWKAKFVQDTRSVASSSKNTGLCHDGKHEIRSARSVADVHFETRALLNLVRSKIKPTGFLFCILLILVCSTLRFYRSPWYQFFYVRRCSLKPRCWKLTRLSWYFPSFDTDCGRLLKQSKRFVAKNATACVVGCIGMSFFYLKEI